MSSIFNNAIYLAIRYINANKSFLRGGDHEGCVSHIHVFLLAVLFVDRAMLLDRVHMSLDEQSGAILNVCYGHVFEPIDSSKGDSHGTHDVEDGLADDLCCVVKVNG
jgi:hypothetical protein